MTALSPTYVLILGDGDIDDAEVYGPYSKEEASTAAQKVYASWTEEDQPRAWVLPLKASAPGEYVEHKEDGR